MPKTSDVRVGSPEQSGTTGAILHAPLGTTLPSLSSIKKTGVTINEAFTGNEYVSEDGLTLSPSRSTTDIKDWSGATVRKVMESFDGTLKWKMISTDQGALEVAFGKSHVTSITASTDHGFQVQAALGAYLPDEYSWVFLMKDGDARIVIVVPDGQITEVGDVTFATNSAVGWDVTLACYPDSSGNSIYIMTDDGQVVTAQ